MNINQLVMEMMNSDSTPQSSNPNYRGTIKNKSEVDSRLPAQLKTANRGIKRQEYLNTKMHGINVQHSN